MKKQDIEHLTKEIALQIVSDNNCTLVDVEYVKEGSNMFLRVYIDKPGGVTIENCQKVSQKISARLDEIDPVEENYFLEVSSPGLDRPLKTEDDLKNNLDKDVDISLYKPVDGTKKLSGRLVDVDEEIVILEEHELGEVKLDRKSIAKINLAVKF